MLGADPVTRPLVLVWRQGAVLGPVAHWAQARLTDLCRGAVEPQRKGTSRRVK
jgi:hypothetical protein